MEAIGSEEADEGPGANPGFWGATTGTCGAESEWLAKGLRLTFSLAPAVGDLLSEATLVSNGIRLSKVFIMYQPLWWIGEGREMVATEPPLHYLHVGTPAVVQQLN